ncbi:MAG TPA: class I SAM-dependent methyltransferase, partial [Tepidisphaeraceae bacterium]
MPDTPPTTAPAPAPQWDDALLQNPHAVADKRTRVQHMFAAIAPSYDLNNRLHSLWMDQRWRHHAAHLSNLQAEDVVVDVACGTGDLTITWASGLCLLNAEADRKPKFGQVLGVDFTFEMLPFAKRKSDVVHDVTAPQDGLGIDYWDKTIQWINGDALALPLPDQCCDVLSIAFGIRNVSDPAAAIAEFHRVLRPGGRLIILEFSLPTNPLLRTLYN